MCPDVRCHVYQMNGSEFDPIDATWVPRNTLGEYSLFIGDNYPIVKRMPPSVHDTEGPPFMKHGSVFSAHRRMNDMLGHAIPNLCRFSLVESPSCGTGLESCDNDSRCPPLWIMPSIKTPGTGTWRRTCSPSITCKWSTVIVNGSAVNICRLVMHKFIT